MRRYTWKFIWLASTAISFCTSFFLNPDYFRGNEKLLGSHDTELPYLASWTLSRMLWNRSTNVYNFFDQVDFSYTHGTTGLYTLPATLTAILSNSIQVLTSVDGKFFVTIHAATWVISQLLIRNLGYVLICRELKLDKNVATLTLGIIQPLILFTMTYHYLIGFVYSFLPLLFFFLYQVYIKFSIRNLVFFIFTFIFAISQAPFFGLVYLGLPIFLLSILFACMKLLTILKNKVWVDSLRFSRTGFLRMRFWRNGGRSLTSLRWLKFTFPLFFIFVSANTLLIVFSYKSFSNNIAIVENRSFLPTYATLHRNIFGSGANNLGSIFSSGMNDTLAGWQYLGLPLFILAIFGFISSFKTRLVRLSFLVAVMLVSIQFSPVAIKPSKFWNEFLPYFLEVPIKTILLYFKTTIFLLFPLSGMFRNSPMLVWLVCILIMIGILQGLHTVMKVIAEAVDGIDGTKSGNKRIFLIFLIFLGATFASYLEITGINLSRIILLIPLALIGYLLIVFRKKRILTFVFIVMFIVSVSITTTALHRSQNSIVYAGGKVQPRVFILESASKIEKNAVIPEWVTPFSRQQTPIFIASRHPSVSPKTGIFMLDTDRRDSNYFGYQDPISSFWGVTFVGDYAIDSYYQLKAKIFALKEFSSLVSTECQGRVLPVAVIARHKPDTQSSSFSDIFPCDEAEVSLTRSFLTGVSARTEHKTVNNRRLNYLVLEDERLRSLGNTSLLSKDLGFTLRVVSEYYGLEKEGDPVFGLPLGYGDYSVNSFSPDSIYLRTDSRVERTVDIEIQVPKVKTIYGEGNSIEYSLNESGNLDITSNSSKPYYMIIQVPYQKNFEIKRDGQYKVKYSDCSGFVCFMLPMGHTNFEIVYRTVPFSNFPFPALIQLLNILCSIGLYGIARKSNIGKKVRNNFRITHRKRID